MMSKSSNNFSKFVNVSTSILEVLFEIVLLPFHIVKAIINVVQELRS